MVARVAAPCLETGLEGNGCVFLFKKISLTVLWKNPNILIIWRMDLKFGTWYWLVTWTTSSSLHVALLRRAGQVLNPVLVHHVSYLPIFEFCSHLSSSTVRAQQHWTGKWIKHRGRSVYPMWVSQEWEVEDTNYVKKMVEKGLISEQDRRMKTFHTKIRGRCRWFQQQR